MSLWPLYLAGFAVLAAVGLILFVLRLRGQESASVDAAPDYAHAVTEAAPVARNVAAGQTAPAQQAPQVQQVPPGPVCPRCRSPLVPRAAAGREILLCSRFPRCNYGSLMK